MEAYSVHMQAERQRMDLLKYPATNFTYYSKRVEEAMIPDDRWPDRDPARDAEDAYDEVKKASTTIFSLINPGSSYGTKCNALRAMFTMARTILDADETLDYELYQCFKSDPCLENAMISVMGTMSDIELVTFRRGKDCVTIDDIYDLHADAGHYGVDGIFGNLPDVISMLEGESKSDDEDGGDSEADRFNEHQANDCR